MSSYEKNDWIDHIEDVETGEILQEGTLYCARLMNHMEDGILNAHSELIYLANIINMLETKVKLLEDSLINNMPHNNFHEHFASVNDVIIIDGIYDETYKKIYA